MNKWILALPLLALAGPKPPARSDATTAPAPTQLPAAPAEKVDYAALKSVTLHTTGAGEAASLDSTLQIRDGFISLVLKSPPADRKEALSPGELKKLIEVLQKADIAKLAGEYDEKGLDDGPLEVLTVVIGTDNAPKTYTVRNHGKAAPPGYYDVKRHLTQLLREKFARPAAAPPAAAPGHHDFADLTSLTFRVTGGFAGVNEVLTLSEGRATFTKNRPEMATEIVFTKDDMKQLAAVLNEANFGALVGNYHQKNLSDGFGETITAVVGTGKSWKAYTVSSYGMNAPSAFYKVTAYLRELQHARLMPVK